MEPTPVTTEDLLRIIGELYVQSWVTRGAIAKRALQDSENEKRQNGAAGIPEIFRQGSGSQTPPSEVM